MKTKVNRDSVPAKPRAKVKKATLADAAKLLGDEDKDTVVRMLLGWAKDDERLCERLLQYAARRLGPETSAAAASRAFERAVRIRSFVDYREARGWVSGVNEAIDNIERLLEDGHPEAVIDLCESALDGLVGASEAIDDSDGYLGDLRDRLQDIHFRACHEARPDPVGLARRLFSWELQGELDVFFGACERYADILGDKGLNEYRRLAEAEWKKVPERKATDRFSSAEDFHITHIMESLARASGNTEELVAVMSRDLSHAYDYLQIAEVYRGAQESDKALMWAEKGLKVFPERTDSRLREFAAKEYHRRERHEDAMKLMWAEFSERPHLETYVTLESHATQAGNWREWRDRALAELRHRIAKTKAESRDKPTLRWMLAGADHSVLVEIFLYERNVEAAWREAEEGGCSKSLWLRLAAVREKEHPADAAPIYLKQAADALSVIRNGRYEEPVDLLVKAAVLMNRLGRNGEFARNLNELCVRYKAKRNFMKLVEQNRKLLYVI